MLTLNQLKQLLPKNKYVEHWHHALSQLLPDYDINTPHRIAAFIAQCSHESGGFTTLKENLNYKPQSLRRLFPKYFPDDVLAQQYCAKPNKQEAIANRIYANRMGNRDESSGDGARFCGRGCIQLTGSTAYYQAGKALGVDLWADPTIVATPEYAALTAGWFWSTHKCNELAEAGDWVKLTKVINGGTVGLDDRIKHINEALAVLTA